VIKIEKEGKIRSVGTQVQKESATMFIEFASGTFWIDSDKKYFIKEVEDDRSRIQTGD